MTGAPYQFSKPAEPWPWSTEILAAKLDHLDPGASLKLDLSVLQAMFGSAGDIELIYRQAEQFAEKHRCSFSYHEEGASGTRFTKDDVF